MCAPELDLPAAEPSEAEFSRSLIEANRNRKSWRERLQWLRDRFADPAFTPTAGELATVAIYLRLLATGELRCEEDGRHFRPNHHAEAALQIETALERVVTPDTAWILRRIYPYLPSWGEEFRRAEPLTRIRDIAHRNDIPQELKREIKQRLQNKLHRCAGPEDLRTSEEILRRVTAPGAGFSPAFVQEFQTFHGELQEFFNATALDGRLRAAASSDPAATESISRFLALKADERRSDDRLFDLLDQLTALRQVLAEGMARADMRRRSQLRLADIALEDYAFALLSECANRLSNPLASPGRLLRALTAALDNLRLSEIEPEECAALRSELTAWSRGFAADNRFHLLRFLATLARARRLAETYTDRINRLFPLRVAELGRALGIAEHAVKVFAEGDIRGHVVFQLSRLVDSGIQAARQALELPPWEPIVPGEARGTLVRAGSLAEIESAPGPLVVVLDEADGDAEIPAGVRGLVLGQPLPHLSHLGVRARQARVPVAASARREQLGELDRFLDRPVRLRVTPDGLDVQPAPAEPEDSPPPALPRAPVQVPEAILAKEIQVVPLDQARPETCGAKAAGAGRLRQLAEQSGGFFQAPRGLALPFGVMEACLDRAPHLRREYLALRERVASTPPGELGGVLDRIRELVRGLRVPAEVRRAVTDFFGPEARLAVRSSANGEDLENLAGAGLYESVVNVPAGEAPAAIAEVWASLWTRRATVSRLQAGIGHDRIHMAVLLQELVTPDLSFILHTADPLTGRRDEALAELAVGLGEVLASAAQPGTPYRLTCHRQNGSARLLACATFSFALRPGQGRGAVPERLDYSRVPLSADPVAAEQLGKRLAAVASFLEEKLGRPQDVEGVVSGEMIHVVQARPQQGLD